MKTEILEKVVQIHTGYLNRRGIEEDPQGEYRLFQSKDFMQLSGDELPDFMPFTPAVDCESALLRDGDVLFLARGTEHRAHYLAQVPECTVAASSFYILRPVKASLHPAFLAWWINQVQAQRYFHTASQGTRLPLVSKATLARLSLPLPDTALQQKILQVQELVQNENRLSLRLVELRRQMIDTLCMQSLSPKGDLS
jgi:hypothetical protein